MKTSRNLDRLGYYLYRLPLYNILRWFSSTEMPVASGKEIDVIIPVIPKDLLTLPYCLDGLKSNVVNKIKDIYLVGPQDERLLKFTKDNNLVFVDENNVLGFGSKNIKYTTADGRNRSGWLFQQFLKLSGNIGTCENFVTIDSDHILIRPHVFLTQDDKFVFYRSQEFHAQYILANYHLLGKLRLNSLSFVAHKMIFNKHCLKELKEIIEKRSGKKWTDAIIDALDNREPSAFSEFELYASFVNKKDKKSKLWLQKALVRSNGIIDIEKFKLENPKVLSITYPEYMKV